jgi:regulator of protease activity HflC (stomatin/prohibitin superfamily)
MFDRFSQVLSEILRGLRALTGRLAGIAIPIVGILVYGLYAHPPFTAVRRGEVLVRTDVLDGSVSVFTGGTVLLVPGLHQERRFSTRDQVYRPTESASASGPAPFQSVEGLSIGIDLAVRWAVDPALLPQMSKDYPDNLSLDLVRPAVQGVMFPLFARYSVHEIFSSKRADIQQQLTTELKPRFAAMGLKLRGVDMGNVDLPQDYRDGMEKLPAERLDATLGAVSAKEYHP